VSIFRLICFEEDTARVARAEQLKPEDKVNWNVNNMTLSFRLQIKEKIKQKLNEL